MYRPHRAKCSHSIEGIFETTLRRRFALTLKWQSSNGSMGPFMRRSNTLSTFGSDDCRLVRSDGLGVREVEQTARNRPHFKVAVSSPAPVCSDSCCLCCGLSIAPRMTADVFWITPRPLPFRSLSALRPTFCSQNEEADRHHLF
jgi:hypothetical protein